MGYNTSAYMDMPINHKIFLAQFDTIKKLADEESCVIVGRCADYALADYPNVVSVFICADEEVKIQELMKRHNITRDKAKDVMIKTDKQRSGYYNYYSSKRWGSSKSYNLCINSSVVGIDGAVEIIKEFAKKKQEFLKINENAKSIIKTGVFEFLVKNQKGRIGFLRLDALKMRLRWGIKTK